MINACRGIQCRRRPELNSVGQRGLVKYCHYSVTLCFIAHSDVFGWEGRICY